MDICRLCGHVPVLSSHFGLIICIITIKVHILYVRHVYLAIRDAKSFEQGYSADHGNETS